MGQRRRKAFTDAEHAVIWTRWGEGALVPDIAEELGRDKSGIRYVIAQRGGIAPAPRRRAPRTLRLDEREEISRGVARGDSLRAIARRLGRAPSSISRELQRHGGRTAYRAASADAAAWARARRPKICRLALHAPLRHLVTQKLRADWSPQQIAHWLRATYPENATLHVSHETIYRTLFVQARGALKADLVAHLRRRHSMRRNRSARTTGRGRGQIVDAVSISARPPEVADRAVPGHWEGDLLLGATHSQIATLVERSSRYVLLVRVPARTSETLVRALQRRIQTLPTHLAHSLTWDRGLEMAQHKAFTIATDVQVYFCDPQSPWQRGSNENTNGLLRQYFPKGTDVSTVTQRQLDTVARKLNTRPRQTLGWQTPADVFASYVATTD